VATGADAVVVPGVGTGVVAGVEPGVMAGTDVAVGVAVVGGRVKPCSSAQAAGS